MSKPPVLFITAHPDDVAFNMGGTARLLMENYKIHSYCLSSGERGYNGKDPSPPLPSKELGDQREAEEVASAALIDAELTFFHQPDGHIFANKDIIEKISDLIKEMEPVAVFTMGPYEKPDHAACFQIARHALYLAKRFWETEFYTNITIGESHNAFNPNIFVNTSAVIEHKKQQCYAHQHHLHDDTYWDKLLERDKALGKIACCETAEAWFSELTLMSERWKRKAGCILMDLPIVPS